MKSDLMKDMGFEFTGVKPAITEKEMNALINIGKDLEIEQYNTHIFYKIQYYFVLSPFFV